MQNWTKFTDVPHQTEIYWMQPNSSQGFSLRKWEGREKALASRLVTCPLLHTKFLGVIIEQWLIPWERSLFCKPLWSGKNDKHTNSNPIFTQQHSAVLGKFSSQFSFFFSDFLEDRYTIDYQYAIATPWLDRGGLTSELFPVNNLRTQKKKKKAEELTVNRGRNSGKLFCTSTQNFQ